MNIKNFLWLTPFFSFTLGYWIMQKLSHTPTTITPALIGKQVHTILPLTTEAKLNLRLIDQKEEVHMPEGIILNQTPMAGTIIKQNQPIFIVTTKKPAQTQAPQCIGLSLETLSEQLKTMAIRPRIFYLPHAYPENSCFAQSPQANEPLENNRLILYISSGDNKPIIWPDFTDLALNDVIEFLHNYDIQPQIIHDYDHISYTHAHYVVSDQRPFAGTLLTLDETKPLSVQLRVRAGG
jgi:beta-lactam-binding protein with PASTA domain